MPHANYHTSHAVEPRCPVCNNTGRAKTETIDSVSMVAWCRCPAGARALDEELAARRGGGRVPSVRNAPPPALYVVSSGYEPGSKPGSRPGELAEAQLIAVGYRADEREGVVHVLTLQIRGERIEIPCDRETADAFASSMGAGKSLRYRLSLEPL